jgi:uncharacterized protein (DUF433 family)
MNAMSMKSTPYAHIGFSDQGTPIIQGTTMKVVELVEAQRAFGWSPEELHFQFPHITLGQIHSALAFYWDHQAELDAEIARRDRYAEESRRKAGPSAIAKKLREQGLLE